MGSCVAFALTGCAGSGRDGAAEAPAQPARVHRTPLALLSGSPIDADEAGRRLRELAGGVVLEELVLERLLRRELRVRGMAVDAEDVERERLLLMRTLNADAGLDEDAAQASIESIRRARGLGPERFAAMLRRNAMLRRLVEEEALAAATDEAIDLAMAIRWGERARVRIIVTPTQRACADLRGQLVNAPERFGELAMQHSIDASASRGGLLAPLSTADPAYPLALTRAIDRLEPGGVSEVLAIEGGYALVRLEERLPAREPAEPAQARKRAREEVILVRERALMEREAARILQEAEITIFDPSLDWAWKNRTGAAE